jgi:hypothetical protein
MISKISHQNKIYTIDLSKPLDISIPLVGSNKNPNAWYIGEPKIEPVEDDGWVAKVSEGA